MFILLQHFSFILSLFEISCHPFAADLDPYDHIHTHTHTHTHPVKNRENATEQDNDL